MRAQPGVVPVGDAQLDHRRDMFGELALRRSGPLDPAIREHDDAIDQGAKFVEAVHHLLVVDPQRVVVGIVSTFAITRWLANQTP